MKPLSLPARQMRQRRINAFYMMPNRWRDHDGQLEMHSFSRHEDRPRTLREMFSDFEVENDDADDRSGNG